MGLVIGTFAIPEAIVRSRRYCEENKAQWEADNKQKEEAERKRRLAKEKAKVQPQ
jgi:hypothetical protein